MGSILFNFLTESVLFDPTHVEEQYITLQESEIAAELRATENFALLTKQNLPPKQSERLVRDLAYAHFQVPIQLTRIC